MASTATGSRGRLPRFQSKGATPSPQPTARIVSRKTTGRFSRQKRRMAAMGPRWLVGEGVI